MYCKTLKTPFAALLGAGISLLPACQESSVETPDIKTDGASVTVKLTRVGSPSESAEPVDLLQFSGGVLRDRLTVTSDQTDPASFDRAEENRIYAVSGHSIEAEPGKTTEEEVARALITAPADAQSAPFFFSATAVLGDDDSSLDLELQRGIARIDLSNADPGLDIMKINVEGAASASYVFPVEDGVCDCEAVTYSREYAEAFHGLEKGVFTLFETAAPLTVTLTGVKAGEPVEIVVETPAVHRNKVYTVSITEDPVDPEQPEQPENPENPVVGNAVVKVSDWETGDSYYPGPDTTTGLKVDVKASAFPENVKYDEATGVIYVPAEGIEALKVAFRSDIRIEIENIELTGAFVEKDQMQDRVCTVNGRTVTESGNDIITTYSIKILPQLVCRSEYMIDLGIRKASMTGVYDHVKICVAEHPDQIRTVTMAGIEWMCFNATGQALEDQIYPLRGKTVDEMYNEHFVDCVGKFFQFGKPNVFSPWVSNDPAQFADQTRDIPWKTPDRMPLPEGYHVASAAEWKALMPNGIVLPSAWMTESGDSIKGTVVTLPDLLDSPSAATNAKKYKQRYVLFESVTTGNRLYVPFAGIKTNSTVEIPAQGGSYTFDNRTAYWVAEDRYIWLIDYKATAQKEDGALLQQNRWNYDGFMPVRGVKD